MHECHQLLSAQSAQERLHSNDCCTDAFDGDCHRSASTTTPCPLELVSSTCILTQLIISVAMQTTSAAFVQKLDFVVATTTTTGPNGQIGWCDTTC